MRLIECKTGEKCNSYAEYLQSKHWKQIKSKFKKSKLFKNHCEICEEQNSIIHIHHKSYKRIGKERLTDLAALCEDCHNELHDKHGHRWEAVRKMKRKAKKK